MGVGAVLNEECEWNEMKKVSHSRNLLAMYAWVMAGNRDTQKKDPLASYKEK